MLGHSKGVSVKVLKMEENWRVELECGQSVHLESKFPEISIVILILSLGAGHSGGTRRGETGPGLAADSGTHPNLHVQVRQQS